MIEVENIRDTTTRYTGTAEELISAGIIKPEMIPQLPRRVCDTQGVGKWYSVEVRRKKGGLFQATAVHEPRPKTYHTRKTPEEMRRYLVQALRLMEPLTELDGETFTTKHGDTCIPDFQFSAASRKRIRAIVAEFKDFIETAEIEPVEHASPTPTPLRLVR